MPTIMELTEQYAQAIDNRNQDARKIVLSQIIDYLNSVIKEAVKIGEPFKSSNLTIYSRNLVLILKDLKDINKQNSPNLFDFVAALNNLNDNPRLHSILVHMIDDAFKHRVYPHPSDSKSTLDRMSWNLFGYDRSGKQKMRIYDGVSSILNSFDYAFRILPRAKAGEIWIPDYSFQSSEPTDGMPLPFGKALDRDNNERPLAFPPSTALSMQQAYWESYGSVLNDKNVRYFSREQKRQFKVRATDEPYVLKRDIDLEKIPADTYLFVVSMHGGLIAIKPTPEDKVRHSTMRAGQNVKAAGEIVVDEQGIITKMNGSSGHYVTPNFNLIQAALYLHHKGMINDQCTLGLRDQKANYLEGKDKKPVSEFTIAMLKDERLSFDSEDIQDMVDEYRKSSGLSARRTFRLN